MSVEIPTLLLYLNSICYFLSIITLILCGIVFLLLRDVQPIKARSFPLVSLLWILLFLQVTHAYISDLVTISCFYGMWIQTILLIPSVGVMMVRCIRLFLIFHLAKRKFKKDKEEIKKEEEAIQNSNERKNSLKIKDDGSKDLGSQLMGKHLKFWQKSSFVSDGNLVRIVGIFFGIAILFPAVYTAIFYPQLGINCQYAQEYIDILLVVVIACAMITLAIKLRKVHDAYYLKMEFRNCALLVLFLPLPLLILVVCNVIEYSWYDCASNYLFWTIIVNSFGVPSIMAVRNRCFPGPDTG